jgi:opacity protein-like surface antigen
VEIPRHPFFFNRWPVLGRLEGNVMRRLTALAIVIASGWVFGTAATAADLPFGQPQPAYVVSEFLSDWYVRGDLAYRALGAPGGSVAGNSFLNSSYDNAVGYGAGAGFKAKWLRVDVTVDGSQSRFVASSPFAAPDITAKVTDVTALANAYFDLGTWSRVTPYVGAGLGMSYLKATGTNSASGFVISSNPQYDFAWAGMAGLSYAVTRNFLVDTGYRYLHVGSLKATLAPVGTLDFGVMNAQEVRIGLRYLID